MALRHSERGSAAVIAIAFFLLLATGLLAYFLLAGTSKSAVVPLQTPPAPAPVAEEGAPLPPTTPEPAATAVSPAAPTAVPEPVPAPPSETPKLRGRVLGPDETPIEEAMVRYLAEAGVGAIHRLVGDEVLLVPDDPAVDIEASVLAAPWTRTDAEGRFELDPAARGALLVSAAGYAPALHRLGEPVSSFSSGRGIDSIQELAARTAGKDILAPPEIPQDIAIQLPIATRIVGTVLSSADGRPAAGAEVLAVPGGEGGLLGMLMAGLEGGARARVDDSGRYGLVVTEAGEVRVGAKSGESDFAPMRADTWVRRSIARGDLEHRVDLELTPGGAIEGRIIAAAGLPLVNARIGVLPEIDLTEMSNASMLGDLDPRRIEVAEDGSFRAGGLPLGRAYRVMGEAEGHARANVLSAELTAAAPRAWVEVAMTRGSTISGRAITAAGDPAPGVSVRLTADFETLMRGGIAAAMNAQVGPATSEEDGSFALANVPAGQYRLVAGESAADFNPFGDAAGEKVDVDGVHDLGGLVVVALGSEEHTTGDLAGRVVDGEGRPLSGVAVVITGVAASADEGAVSDVARVELVTDAAGRFEAPGMAYAGVTVEASLEGHAGGPELLGEGETEIEIVLAAVGTIRGRVMLADGSVPAVPFRVAAEAAGERPGEDFQARMIRMMGGETAGEPGHEDGTFELGEVPIGGVTVVARASGHAPARSRTLDMAPGAVIEGVELVLSHGASILGAVTDPAGAPLAGAKVLCLPAADASGFGDMMAQMMPALYGGEAGIVTAADGTYEVAHLEPGEYLLRALHPEYARSESVKVLVRGEEAKEAPALAMLLGGTLEGRVLRAGTPVSGMMVQLFSGGAFRQGMTDAAGAFRFDNLPDGEHSVMAMDLAAMMRKGGGTGIRSQTVAVGAGETATVELAFGTGHAVSGTVEPVPAGQMPMVTLRRPGGPAPEDVDPLDTAQYAESARHQVGVAMLGADGAFSITDVEPGEYILEVPALPENPMDMEAYQAMDRTPHHRQTITVGDSDVTVRIRL